MNRMFFVLFGTVFALILMLIPLVNAVRIMPITIQSDHLILVGKPLLYLNGTDGYYHVKGVSKSIAKYTLPNVLMTLEFKDAKTGFFVTTANTLNATSISPNQTSSFDINTTYTKVKGDKEFRYFNTTIGDNSY